MRFSSIDVLRMVAIFVMVIVHFAENLSGVVVPITGFGAPLFVFLSGLSYRLWVHGLEATGTRDEEISKRSIRRGLFIFGCGFAFNLIVWLPEDLFNWDVLTFIGFSMLVLNGMRRLPLAIPILVTVLSILISPILRGVFDYPAYWVNHYFEYDLTLSDVLIGFLATGYFPIFPWIAYSLTGLSVGSWVLRPSRSLNIEDKAILEKQITSKIIGLGASLIVASGLLLIARPYLPAPISNRLFGGWTMFPPSTEYVIATIGWALIVFRITHLLIDRPIISPQVKGFLNIAKSFSRYSLTIYVLHHLFHLWPMWIYAIVNGEEPTFYWQKMMPVTYSIPLAFLFLIGCYFILRKLGPDRRWGIEGWMRWLCD
ncbi:MAG: heparan-alpha-glucosaminide N-acetyltransferase domain-containing protein [Planctomycetota bacterium]|nr:heparan-alpha-glucosaminide N-acetyltransferase domain-containing protein [Planctomycetota bacterium]